jgi:carbamoyltransferase
VVDGMGSPEEDLLEDERLAIHKRVEDGWETISLYEASGTSLVAIEKHLVVGGAWLSTPASGMPRFGSLGGMFSAVAKQVFGHDMEAGKVMGLAPYGKPEMTAQFFEISNGSFTFLDTVPGKFGHDDRWPARQDEYRDLACSVQAALESALFHLLRRLRILCASENLCYAGGVALNSVANERIIRESGFKRVFIPPAAEDSGPAIGAAYHGLWQMRGENSHRGIVHDACGKLYPSRCVSTAIEAIEGVRSIRSADTISDAVALLCDGKMVGWFDGRSELGPRALGQRSILCDPRQARYKELLNRKIKKREPFRPFAPVVLLEEVKSWFDSDGAPLESPFMLRVCRFRPERRGLVPAVVHVDGTGRLQTVTKEANGRFYQLVRKFCDQTGVPILLNTSFNVAGEPLVETPEDAINCLLKTELDCCIFEDQIVFRHVGW